MFKGKIHRCPRLFWRSSLPEPCFDERTDCADVRRRDDENPRAMKIRKNGGGNEMLTFFLRWVSYLEQDGIWGVVFCGLVQSKKTKTTQFGVIKIALHKHSWMCFWFCVRCFFWNSTFCLPLVSKKNDINHLTIGCFCPIISSWRPITLDANALKGPPNPKEQLQFLASIS